MRSAPSLGQIFKVRMRLHYTWFVGFVLIIAIVMTQFPPTYPIWQRIIFGIAASLAIFIAVLIREFALRFLAGSRGIPVKRVTLFVFGGVPQITEEVTLPILERLMSVAGLLSNLVIAGIFYAVYAGFINTGNVAIIGLMQWLTYIYFLLALFHFIPGFPLDGGRLLRSFLWTATGSYDWATRIASWTGWGIGLAFIAGGIISLIITHQWFVGLLVFAGWVLQSEATQIRRQTALREALKGITARDIICKECPLISQQISIDQLVRDYILVTAQRYFVVADGVKLQGIVTMRNIRPVPRGRWKSTYIGEIMTPLTELKTADSKQSAASLLDQMDDLEIDLMPVLEADEVIGIVTRDSITRLVEIQAELGI